MKRSIIETAMLDDGFVFRLSIDKTLKTIEEKRWEVVAIREKFIDPAYDNLMGDFSYWFNHNPDDSFLAKKGEDFLVFKKSIKNVSKFNKQYGFNISVEDVKDHKEITDLPYCQFCQDMANHYFDYQKLQLRWSKRLQLFNNALLWTIEKQYISRTVGDVKYKPIHLVVNSRDYWLKYTDNPHKYNLEFLSTPENTETIYV